MKDIAEQNRGKSEAALAEVDGLDNEQAVNAKLGEADKFRGLAEEAEIEAKNQQMILKNNVAEARSKKKEAELILVGIDEQKHAALLAAVESDNSDLKKVQEYVASEVDINSNEEEVFAIKDNSSLVNKKANIGPTTKSSKEIIDDVEILAPELTQESEGESDVEFSSPELVEINMDNIALLDGGDARNSVSQEFNINSDNIYNQTTKIPVDPPMPKGIIYQVQVGAFRQKIDPRIFNGLTPLVGEQLSNGITRYKVGYFRGFTSANIAKGRIRQLGYPDAFVVVFYNGKKITVEKAEEVITAADESEQFVYKNLVMDEVKQLKSLGITSEEGDDLLLASSVPNELEEQSIQSNTSATEVVPTEENGLTNDLLKINGLFYTVQVGVYKTPRESSDLYGLSPLYT